MKELEDHVWFPSVLRNEQTRFIGYVVSKFRIYKPFIQKLKSEQKHSMPMYDLCSGSGEPAMSIFEQSKAFSNLTLTDKYPNSVLQSENKILYLQSSSDVLDMQFHKENIYTMFNAFHHFSDAEKTIISERILASGAKAYFVEILNPSIVCLLKTLFATTIGVLVLSPFIKPFQWKSLLLTYLLPLNIVCITFDGIISVLKSRSTKQYREIFLSFKQDILVTKTASRIAPLIIIELNPQ